LGAIQPHMPEMLTPGGLGLPKIGETPNYADLIANAQTAPTSPFINPALPALPAETVKAPQQPGAPDATDPSFFGPLGARVQQAAGAVAGAIGAVGAAAPPSDQSGANQSEAQILAAAGRPIRMTPASIPLPPSDQSGANQTEAQIRAGAGLPVRWMPNVPGSNWLATPGPVTATGGDSGGGGGNFFTGMARALPWRRGPDGRLIFLGEGEAA
jgi:hypothetical protein